MTFGVFNLESGNLIDSVDTEREAVELVTGLLDEGPDIQERLGLLVVDDDGHTVGNLHGEALAIAVRAGGIPIAEYA